MGVRTSKVSRSSKPVSRRLRAYAFDPSLSLRFDTAGLNQHTLAVPWEEELTPGPVGEYVEVVDYDPATGSFYSPVDLDDPHLLAQDGLAPSEGSPHFHQQMVYGVVMTTIGYFERALGRKALWAPRVYKTPNGRITEEYVQRLRVYPHALREANAYYTHEKKALLFGYFPAQASNVEGNLPGGMVFTCLSHDIVAHETTHALLDGLHPRFTEPSNQDVLAFHEAFADIVALFQHFSYPEVLRQQIAATRGDLGRQNLLGGLAAQFGQALGQRGALRDFIGTYVKEGDQEVWKPHTPTPKDLDDAVEPHTRGAVLVAAIFDTFLTIYKHRVADLLRIAARGAGETPPGDLHPDLVERLAREAGKSAQQVLLMCIRALDYCPPVDLTFGDYLRALITADADLVPDDDRHYRLAITEAFRRRGIYPQSVRTLSEEALRWHHPSAAEQESLRRLLPTQRDLGALSLQWKLTGNRAEIFETNRTNRRIVHTWLESVTRWATSRQLDALGWLMGLDLARPMPPTEVHSVRPVRRVGPDGQHLTDLIIEITQSRPGYLDPDEQKRADREPPARRKARRPTCDFMFRGGCTVILSLESGEIRYAITKNVQSESRLARQRAFIDSIGSVQATYFSQGPHRPLREPFAMLHRSGSAFDAGVNL